MWIQGSGYVCVLVLYCLLISVNNKIYVTRVSGSEINRTAFPCKPRMIACKQLIPSLLININQQQMQFHNSAAVPYLFGGVASLRPIHESLESLSPNVQNLETSRFWRSRRKHIFICIWKRLLLIVKIVQCLTVAAAHINLNIRKRPWHD